MGFQDLSWNITLSSLMILAASVFEISCGKTELTRPPRLLLDVYSGLWRVYSCWSCEAVVKDDRLGSSSYIAFGQILLLQCWWVPVSGNLLELNSDHTKWSSSSSRIFAPTFWGIGPPSSTWFLVQPESASQTASRSVQLVLQGSWKLKHTKICWE